MPKKKNLSPSLYHIFIVRIWLALQVTSPPRTSTSRKSSASSPVNFPEFDPGQPPPHSAGSRKSSLQKIAGNNGGGGGGEDSRKSSQNVTPVRTPRKTSLKSESPSQKKFSRKDSQESIEFKSIPSSPDHKVPSPNRVSSPELVLQVGGFYRIEVKYN